jgi:uncharacterized protein YegL
MNKNLTEIIFVLDRSGSMSDLTNDTIGGFNSFLEEQRKEVGEAKLTTILFDDKYEILHDGIDLINVGNLTNKEYYARGMTALFDAVGKTIKTVGERLSKTEESDRPNKVVFVITTDGQENSSKEFTKETIKEMITKQTDKYNWQFLFLGANIDSAREASAIGIKGMYSVKYTASAAGTDSLYRSVSKTVSNVRGGLGVDETWKNEVL